MKQANLIHDLRQSVGGEVLDDRDTLASLSFDWGGICRKRPRVVIRPKTPADIAAAIRIGVRYHVPVTCRSAGHSQSGQSLNQDGILIDMTSFNHALEVNEIEKSCIADAGMFWKDVIAGIKPRKLIPPVLTDHLYTTVGGTLSTGGCGNASFLYGTQADNCLALHVVTGTGEMIECNPAENAELFYYTLCGLGQLSIITRVKLQLRTHHSHVRTFLLYYDNLKTMLSDLRKVINDERAQYLQAHCLSAEQPKTRWFFLLKMMLEFDPVFPPDDKQCLSGLNFLNLRQLDNDIYEFIGLRKKPSEYWNFNDESRPVHPWMDAMMPWEQTETYIQRILETLPFSILKESAIVLIPAKNSLLKMPLFRKPDSDLIMLVGFFPSVSKNMLDAAVSANKIAGALSEELSGKRYVSSLIHFDKEGWKKHYGPVWEEFKQLKNKYDPHRILNPAFIDYSL